MGRMILIDGKKVSDEIKKELKKEIEENNLKPGLGIILVGNREDSKTYVRMKIKACNLIGITNYDVYLPEDTTENELFDEVNKMNNNNNIHGILIQLPLPNHINEANILNQI